jgi:hypothetical protein
VEQQRNRGFPEGTQTHPHKNSKASNSNNTNNNNTAKHNPNPSSSKPAMPRLLFAIATIASLLTALAAAAATLQDHHQPGDLDGSSTRTPPTARRRGLGHKHTNGLRPPDEDKAVQPFFSSRAAREQDAEEEEEDHDDDDYIIIGGGLGGGIWRRFLEGEEPALDATIDQVAVGADDWLGSWRLRSLEGDAKAAEQGEDDDDRMSDAGGVLGSWRRRGLEGDASAAEQGAQYDETMTDAGGVLGPLEAGSEKTSVRHAREQAAADGSGGGSDDTISDDGGPPTGSVFRGLVDGAPEESAAARATREQGVGGISDGDDASRPSWPWRGLEKGAEGPADGGKEDGAEEPADGTALDQAADRFFLDDMLFGNPTDDGAGGLRLRGLEGAYEDDDDLFYRALRRGRGGGGGGGRRLGRQPTDPSAKAARPKKVKPEDSPAPSGGPEQDGTEEAPIASQQLRAPRHLRGRP